MNVAKREKKGKEKEGKHDASCLQVSQSYESLQ